MMTNLANNILDVQKMDLNLKMTNLVKVVNQSVMMKTPNLVMKIREILLMSTNPIKDLIILLLKIVKKDLWKLVITSQKKNLRRKREILVNFQRIGLRFLRKRISP